MNRWHAPLALVAVVSLAALFPSDTTSISHKVSPAWQPEMSAMGRIAWGLDPAPVFEAPLPTTGGPHVRQTMGFQGNDRRVHSPTAPDYQSETTIAVNGDEIVVGYNDARGFSLSPQSVSGFSYSSDGGDTWTDGGSLPTAGGDGVLGDPDVKTWTDGFGTKYFVYSSLYLTPGGQRSLCIHVSTNGGATWTLPRNVTGAATPSDFPDKEFIDIDPETGRLFISWTHFPSAGSVTMRTAYSDDFGLTWSAVTTFASVGQGSMPRASSGTTRVYLAWRSGSTIVMATSTNNGATWLAPATIATGLVDPMNPYGSDRINGFPSIDVDASGNVYLVYASRKNPPDFGDILFSRFMLGSSWTTPVAINTNPGNDRVQCFPALTLDKVDGSLHAIWYDQVLGAGTSDLTDIVHRTSLDGGLTWDCPTVLTDRPFHAESGNRTSQPNIGDYIQCVSINQKLYAAFAGTNAPSVLTFTPDTYVDISESTPASAPLAFVQMTSTDTGCRTANGFWEPCETINITVKMKNYGVCGSLTSISGTLSTASPYVQILDGTKSFSNTVPLPGGQTTNASPFQIFLDPSTPCGTLLTFEMAVTSAQGNAKIFFDQRVGRPVVTNLLTQNFDGGAAPALPAGWATSTLVGTANPWVTTAALASTGPNAAFCADIGSTSLSELSSPAIVIPAGTEIVRVMLDETHNMEIDVERKAWDGGLMRVMVGGTRYLAGAIGQMEPFYPWQMNRGQSATSPLQDLACWSDNTSPSFMHYQVDMPDLGGQTINVLFDVSCDPSVGTASGMFIDNVVVQAIDYACDCTEPPVLAATPTTIDFGNVHVDSTVCDTVTIANTGPTQLVISSISGCGSAPFSLDDSMTDYTLDKGESTTLVVCVTPTESGSPSCQIQIDSNDPNGPDFVDVGVGAVTGAGDAARRFEVLGAFPNPFNPQTTIRFTLPSRQAVTAQVFDVNGALVKVLANGRNFEAGTHELPWSGSNQAGSPIASGVYFVRIQTALGSKVIRAVLLK